jgi:hypothetical protein
MHARIRHSPNASAEEALKLTTLGFAEKAKGETQKMEQAQENAARQVFDKVCVSPTRLTKQHQSTSERDLWLTDLTPTRVVVVCTGTRARASPPSICTASRSSPL